MENSNLQMLKDALTPIQKKAVMKLAVDLAKADKQIHGGEVMLLNDYQKCMGLMDDELEMIHYMSTQECIEVLYCLDDEIKACLIGMLASIVEIDVDVDQRERILLSAIRMTLDDLSGGWTKVFSVTGVEAECSSNQIIYLEKNKCHASREVLDDAFNSLLLTKALNDVGLQLFYLPKVKEKLDVYLLCQSMEYILPSCKSVNLGNLTDSLDEVTSRTLFNAFCSTFRLSPGIVGFDSFLMLKLQESETLNDDGILIRSIDFICIDVTENMRGRVSHFVEQLDNPSPKLSYDGYYRLLYDHLMSSSAVRSSVRIDLKGDLYLSDAGNQKLIFESAPQSKTFYLLLLRYGAAGISQVTFETAFEYLEKVKAELAGSLWNYDAFMSHLEKTYEEHTVLIHRIMSIYTCVSTKNPTNVGFLNYIINIIKHRSTLKNYINNGFRSAAHLADKENYYVQFNQDTKSYYVSQDMSLFAMEEGMGNTVSLSKSRLWQNMYL